MAEIETFEMNVEDFSASTLNDADVSSSGIDAQMPADRAKPVDKSDDHGYVLEMILLNHLKVIWSCIRFLASYWKVIGSVLLAIIPVVIYFGIQYFNECNTFLAQNDLPVMPSLEDLNAMVEYNLFVYFAGGFVIFILALAAWCSIDWKRMVSTETRRFVCFCLANMGSFCTQILNSISSLFHTCVIGPLVALFRWAVSIPWAVISWFLSLVMWIITKGDKICRRRFLFIFATIGVFAHWLWGRAYPLNPVEQLAAFAERHRDNDIFTFTAILLYTSLQSSSGALRNRDYGKMSGSTENRIFFLQDIPGKGKGLIATNKILKGTRILSEETIMRVPDNAPDSPVLQSSVRRQVDELTSEQRQAFLSMCNVYPSNTASQYIGIIRTNTLPIDIGGGIFIDACRINHACDKTEYHYPASWCGPFG